jgi:hypothetical protein
LQSIAAVILSLGAVNKFSGILEVEVEVLIDQLSKELQKRKLLEFIQDKNIFWYLFGKSINKIHG